MSNNLNNSSEEIERIYNEILFQRQTFQFQYGETITKSICIILYI